MSEQASTGRQDEPRQALRVISTSPSIHADRTGPRFPELLATSSSDVLFEGSPDQVIEWISDGVTPLLGWSPDELIGHPVYELAHPDSHDELRRARTLVHAGEEARLRVRMHTKSGGTRWVETLTKPIVDAAGNTICLFGSVRDAQHQVAVEEELRRANTLKDLMFATMLDPIVILACVRDDEGQIVDFRYLDANPAACAYNGLPLESMTGRRITELFAAFDGSPTMREYCRVVDTAEPMVVDGWSFFNDLYGGTERCYDVRAVKLNDGLVVTWRDVTERVDMLRELALGKEHYRLIADNSSDVVVHTRDDRIVWASPSIEATTGIAAEQSVGCDVSGLVHEDDRHIADAGAEAVARGESPVFRLRLQEPDGTRRWVELHPVTYYDTFSQPDGVITSVRFVDDLVRAQEELTHAAHHDAVTGMLNRHEVLNRLTGITTHPARTGTDVAIVFCDLDVFKPINDEHGHAAGDDVLRTVAERIRACIRTDDLAARIGGDELLVVLPNVHGLEEATDLAEKIREAVTGAITTRAGVDVVTTVSIGVTLAHHGESSDEIVQRADRAMYEAKRAGGNRVVAVA